MNAPAGLTSLFDLHREELLRFLRARCGNVAEAEDCLQELWLKSSGEAAGPIANGRAYLFRMANNLVLDIRRGQLRAMQRDQRWLEADSAGEAGIVRTDPDMPADEALVHKQEADILARAISQLPAGAQRALRLHRIDGHSQSEVAQIMGISRSGVEKHLCVAMKHLRAALTDCGYFDGAASKTQGRSDAARLRPDGTT
jgi:RNA polymerase sigma factor (sigma-70 family)